MNDQQPWLKLPELIRTDRLELRAPSPAQAWELRQAIWDSIDALRPWMPWAKEVPTQQTAEANLRKARERWDAGEDMRVSVFLKGTDILVGSSGLHEPDWAVPRFEIGYWIRTGFTGKGYATETVRALSELALGALGANRVEILASTQNVASCRVALAAGFTLEATLRNHERHLDGTLRDTAIFAKLATPPTL